MVEGGTSRWRIRPGACGIVGEGEMVGFAGMLPIHLFVGPSLFVLFARATRQPRSIRGRRWRISRQFGGQGPTR